MIAALLLVRLYPLPLRWLMRPAARLRGAVGHLSLARAGRTSVSAVLPLLALLTALTTAAFGGSVLTGVAEARDRTALSAVGADARVQGAGELPAGLAGQLRRTPGVRTVTEAGVDYRAKAGSNLTPVTLAGVAPADYAALAARTGLGAFPAGRLRQPADHAAPLPALASPSVAAARGTAPFTVQPADGPTVTVRIVAVRDRTPAVPGTDFLVVDRAGLNGGKASTTTLLVTGDHLDAAALRRAAGASASVRLRSAERARYVDSPLQSGAERVYLAAVAAGVGLRRPRPAPRPAAGRPRAGRAAGGKEGHGPHPRPGPPPARPGVPAAGAAGRGGRGADRVGDHPAALPRHRPDRRGAARLGGLRGRGRPAHRPALPGAARDRGPAPGGGRRRRPGLVDGPQGFGTGAAGGGRAM
ncbi:LOW QUALITY PROTEIN: membrane protein, partial [Streptomyces sp. e14]